MKRSFGLSETDIEQIHAVLKIYPEIKKAVIYGSRAKGNYREGSDIDLTLYGMVSVKIVADVMSALDDSYLPYTFDVSAFELIENGKLREHIGRVGRVFYERDGGINATWPTKKLSELCDVFTDGDWIESKDQSENGIRLIQTGNIGEGHFKDRGDKARFITNDTFRRLRCTEIFEGDCLISRLPEPVGRACMIPYLEEKMITAVDCTIIRFNHKFVIPKFFNYYSQSVTYLEDIKRETSGTTRMRISRSKLSEICIPLPSLPEQKRIVAILDEAFTGIARAKEIAEKNLENAREVFDATLLNTFENGGEGWQLKKISEIAKHSLGKMLDKAKNKGTPQTYLRNFNVRWFTFDLTDLLQMPFHSDEFEKYTVKKGDVLICEGGYPGRAAVWTEDYQIHFQKALHRVRFHDSFHSEWFVYYLYSQDKCGKLKMHFNGTGIQHFTGEVLHEYQVPIPPPKELQRILNTFAQIHGETKNLAIIYEEKLKKIDALKKSLLHRAFSGTL